jgi:hypothetical protein
MDRNNNKQQELMSVDEAGPDVQIQQSADEGIPLEGPSVQRSARADVWKYLLNGLVSNICPRGIV